MSVRVIAFVVLHYPDVIAVEEEEEEAEEEEEEIIATHEH